MQTAASYTGIPDPHKVTGQFFFQEKQFHY
ncbi:hypothetical protein Barb6XT_00797 [Bacteroidales bacterium Barb6XT]|nr:hypothetical protein Barb6XT_00797 [Bacteroidales bacterium Barb6XT]